VLFALTQCFCDYDHLTLRIGSPPMSSNTYIICPNGHNWWRWTPS
jgi:hypothetical protein